MSWDKRKISFTSTIFTARIMTIAEVTEAKPMVSLVPILRFLKFIFVMHVFIPPSKNRLEDYFKSFTTSWILPNLCRPRKTAYFD